MVGLGGRLGSCGLRPPRRRWRSAEGMSAFGLVGAVILTGAWIPQGGAGQVPLATLPPPTGEHRIVLSDLGVRLEIPPEFAESPFVLGVDAHQKIAVWVVESHGQSMLLRFDPGTGDLQETHVLTDLPLFRTPGLGQLALARRGQKIYGLDGRRLLVFGLEGGLLNVIDLDFPPRSIIGVAEGILYLEGDRGQSFGPIHSLLLDEGRLMTHSSPAEDMEAEGQAARTLVARRHGAVRASGVLWTVPQSHYQLEEWGADVGDRTRILAVHPAFRHYLSGAYSEMRVTGVHLTEDRFLWVFVRLRRRDPPAGPFETPVARFAAEFDGLVEVIDLDRAEVVASRHLPTFGLAGWVSGSVGYRMEEAGILALIHGAVEATGSDSVPRE